MKIRQENINDYKAVKELTFKAFEQMEFSDGDEYLLVGRLRKSDTFIPELSLVAEENGEIIGHIMLTKLKIVNGSETYHSLSLGPVSVSPELQRKGIGSKLIKEAHRIAKELGHKSIILVGHKDYYPRFGYELASKHGIQLPFEIPKEVFMVKLLTENALEGISGKVVYPKEFFPDK